MLLSLKKFIAYSGRNSSSIQRETGIFRQRIDKWLSEDRAIKVRFDARTYRVAEIFEKPPTKYYYGGDE
jgi:hypothetical protein